MLRYAAEYKDLDEPLPDFVVRRGGLNECAVRGLLVVLGEVHVFASHDAQFSSVKGPIRMG